MSQPPLLHESYTDDARPAPRHEQTEVKSVPITAAVTEQTLRAQSVQAPKTDAVGRETPLKPGSSYPAIKTSDVDVDANPIFESGGKPITEMDMDGGT